MNFDSQYSTYQKIFEGFLNQEVAGLESSLNNYYKSQLQSLSLIQNHIDFNASSSEKYSKQIQKFFESVKYSLMGEGKRFRPTLCLATADLFGKENHSKVLPLALAIEMIHTYSLIHDDLPSMDNDDVRRGKPTNHKAFGEATALLAGDALLTESFRVLSKNSQNPELNLKVVNLLTECAGLLGMIGGQVVDLAAQKNKVSAEELAQMQINKTGALMRASVVGSGILCGANAIQIEALEEFSRHIGLTFQIADDLLDADKQELGSFVGILGYEKAKALLDSLTKESLSKLRTFEGSEFLCALSKFNSQRLK